LAGSAARSGRSGRRGARGWRSSSLEERPRQAGGEAGPRQAGGEAGPRQAGGEAEPGRQTCAFSPRPRTETVLRFAVQRCVDSRELNCKRRTKRHPQRLLRTSIRCPSPDAPDCLTSQSRRASSVAGLDGQTNAPGIPRDQDGAPSHRGGIRWPSGGCPEQRSGYPEGPGWGPEPSGGYPLPSGGCPEQRSGYPEGPGWGPEPSGGYPLAIGGVSGATLRVSRGTRMGVPSRQAGMCRVNSQPLAVLGRREQDLEHETLSCTTVCWTRGRASLESRSPRRSSRARCETFSTERTARRRTVGRWPVMNRQGGLDGAWPGR